MNFFYTATTVFNKENDGNGTGWNRYVEWSRLSQITEVVSLDDKLNPTLVMLDVDNELDWQNVVIMDDSQMNYYTSLDYVIDKVEGKEPFNLLAVAIDPAIDCRDSDLENFEFLGYDLIDRIFDISALSNCGGFDETFSPEELNQFGLLDDYERARAVWKKLPENNPDVQHAYTYLIAVWRHKQIGCLTPKPQYVLPV